MVVFARIKAAFLADAPPGNAAFGLERSFSLSEGVRRFKRHRWRARDSQYILLLPLLLFCFIICDAPSPIYRLLIALVLLYLVTVPALSQFFLNFLPTATWLILFYSCRYIPPAWRPSIFVRVLPGLETIFYGGNLSATLAAKTNSFLDILAWIPYGLCHYGAPVVISIFCFVFGPPTLLPVFMFAFGYMNIAGVFIQILFPTAPPWYQTLYGLQKAYYGMKGSAGGLHRVDLLLGVDMYTSAFEASPQVFGAFPSLHSGSAVMEACFMTYLFPSMGPVFAIYVMWIWWSTMYLTHHYFIDLIAGAILSLSVFYICQETILPRKQPGKFGRWSYGHVEYGLPQPIKTRKSFDEEVLFDEEQAIEMTALSHSESHTSGRSTPRQH
ncbi:Inositol phosphorylceramide synthase catalytic subunit AUR1 [Wickerhamiella sorbophila]|uniref:Inositol phosphorylceramide synthase catalytic subunit AUR1 n=1 Tax=Wickerhamiella sorbophila TaxID=45607 RepID=A0A2T0FMA2_9ASCO|nr:Inositol phosphorylceramide synthase catalytic subunit AUR1 [Wickerhamiella sorbophila]PRT56110.1 Inositol phosphorylceramide synthase catalytic subunit AUR1 [Wickerhamiella sorbophila]